MSIMSLAAHSYCVVPRKDRLVRLDSSAFTEGCVYLVYWLFGVWVHKGRGDLHSGRRGRRRITLSRPLDLKPKPKWTTVRRKRRSLQSLHGIYSTKVPRKLVPSRQWPGPPATPCSFLISNCLVITASARRVPHCPVLWDGGWR